MELTYDAQADAFMRAVATHHDRLLSYATALCGTSEAGHDLLYETLLKCRERIYQHGFHGQAYLPYVTIALKGNFCYARRNPPLLVALEAIHELPCVPSEEASDLAAISREILNFIQAHYTPAEAEVFELHANGSTHTEIAFVTEFTYYQSRRVVKKIKSDLRAAFRPQPY